MRDLPKEVAGYGRLRPHALTAKAGDRTTKILPDIDSAIKACGLRDGDTVSFHHHLRDGDGVLNLVLDRLAARGLKGLHVAATSIFPVHAPLVDHIRNGTVARLSASFIAGPVGAAVSRGLLQHPVVLRTHGGRARALDMGELVVDAAFVAAPAADEMGNLSGRVGRNACGTLGYPLTDVAIARSVVAVTDTLVPYPAPAIDIAQDKVDFVVAVDSIGDAGGIASGTTRPATDPVSRGIGHDAAGVIAASGLLAEGFSFQTGAGGVSLATADAVGRMMAERGVIGSFCAGGITGFHVAMLNAGLFRGLLDVQCFDLEAVASYRDDPRHQMMSAATYAGPHVGGAVVDRVDAVVLGAAEVDAGFNVNVTTKAGGMVIGGSGGHADAAAGARLAIITTRLTAAGFAKIVPEVGTVTTPGHTVDVVVTEAGIAVNPLRAALAERLRAAGLPVVDIAALCETAARTATRVTPPRATGRVVAVSEYRDASVTDVVRAIEGA
ncbi:citrate lyase subunit alpha [Sagittula salina]|uniref:Citrate lyase alpha chain n=1 Tax=Sagittula salina TaxID=2820268 RepID=A0A940S3C0_9RHOB|nr:citrate lyase subunit alpha [Sagittula salina]MBP0484926.1 citrate lyase subunit alpha [Sagittula salina]